MAGERRVWEAIARSTGVALVHTLEPFVGALAYLQRWWGVGEGRRRRARRRRQAAGRVGPRHRRVPATTPACVSNRRRPRYVGTLRGLGLGAGTSVANPLEIPFGPAAPVDTLRSVLVPLLREQALSPTCSCTSTSPRTTGTAPEASSRWSPNSPDLAATPLGDASVSVVLSNVDVTPRTPTRTSARRRGWGSRPGDVPHARRGPRPARSQPQPRSAHSAR